LFYFEQSNETNLNDFILQYKEKFGLWDLLVKLPKNYKEKLEIDYYNDDLSHTIDLKKFIYTDILICLKSGYQYIQNSDFRQKIYGLSEGEIKEQIKANIPKEKHITTRVVGGGSYKRQIIKKVIRKY